MGDDRNEEGPARGREGFGKVASVRCARHHPPSTRSFSMTTTETSPVRNGVDTEALFATINHVKSDREARRLPVPGVEPLDERHPQPHSVSTFSGAKQELEHLSTYEVDSDHPVVLTGSDQGPTPVEYLLVGLAGCLTAGSRTSPRRAASRSGRSSRRSRATSTCRGSSASRPRCATATSRSGCRSASTPTRTRRPCGHSSSSRGRAPRSSTSSRTARPSRSTSTS